MTPTIPSARILPVRPVAPGAACGNTVRRGNLFAAVRSHSPSFSATGARLTAAKRPIKCSVAKWSRRLAHNEIIAGSTPAAATKSPDARGSVRRHLSCVGPGAGLRRLAPLFPRFCGQDNPPHRRVSATARPVCMSAASAQEVDYVLPAETNHLNRRRRLDGICAVSLVENQAKKTDLRGGMPRIFPRCGGGLLPDYHVSRVWMMAVDYPLSAAAWKADTRRECEVGLNGKRHGIRASGSLPAIVPSPSRSSDRPALNPSRHVSGSPADRAQTNSVMKTGGVTRRGHDGALAFCLNWRGLRSPSFSAGA